MPPSQASPRDATSLALSQAIAAIGQDHFFEALLGYIGAVVDNDSALVLLCDHDTVPAVRCDRLLPSQRRRFYETWMSGTFQLGPYYRLHRQNWPDGLYTLAEIAPDNFASTEFFKAYYRQIRQSDMAGFLIRTGEARHAIIYLSRMLGNPRFTQRERRALMEIKGVVIATTAKHAEIRRDRRSGQDVGQNQELLASFGRGVLSEREYEIVHLLLEGYSSKQMAHRLEITDHTVRAHLKHAYRKMKVRSQAELFSLLLRHMGT